MPSLAPPARRPRLLSRHAPAVVLAGIAAMAGIAALAAVPPARAGDSAAGPARRPITETDLFRFVWVADPQISPDGRSVAFVRVTVDAKREGYDTALWMVAADGSAPPRPFTSGRRDTSPRWSPDGRHLAFLRAGEKPGRGGEPQLYLLSLDGGEARALTELSGGVDSPVWSPDARSIAFANGANEKDLAKAEQGREAAAPPTAGQATKAPAGHPSLHAGNRPEDEHESDVHVVTRTVYRHNGGGFADDSRPSHLWTVALPTADGGPLPAPRQLTRGAFEEQQPVWSADGKLLYFVSQRVKDPAYAPARTGLYAVDAGPAATPSDSPREVLSFDGAIDTLALSRDGRRFAWTGTANGHPERSYDESDLFVADNSPGASPRNLTAAFDGDIGAGLSGDQQAPRGGEPGGPAWSADGESIYAVAAVRGRAKLMRFAAAIGRAEPLTSGDQEVVGYTASADLARVALTLSSPTRIGDLFAFDVASHRLLQLTRFNDELFAGIALTPPEEIVYKSFDGREIEAWVQKPPDFEAGRKYPLVLDIHGGPHTAYGYAFDHEFQWLAAKGYVVLYPNPRGSSSYGEEFGNIIQYRYPGDDATDLLAGVDEVIRRGYVDPQRLGVTGGSGGGVLTNWLIGHSDRFAAAVSQRSIADWAGFWYTTDFSLFTRSWFKGAPWEDPADYAARSPITYVTRIKTPLMLIEGDADLRTPPADGGEQMFRALRYLKRPVVMVRFPGESHELSRSGQPWHRIERLRHLAGWFDKYLQGKAVAGYDVP